MTRRERYLAALRNEPVDALVWAPNLDYWLRVSQAEGTLPERYRGMTRNGIVGAIGGTIWSRASGIRTVLDPAVRERWRSEDGHRIHEIDTPVGSLREVFSPTEGEHRTKAHTEHLVKEVGDLRVLRYVVEATRYEPDLESVRAAAAETGEDGIVLSTCGSVPFIHFAKMDAGYGRAFYLWADHRGEVDALVEARFESYLQGNRVLAEGPVDVITCGDDMDGVMFPPDLFREYAVPYYQELARILKSRGKILQGHWCGRTRDLLPLVPGSGLDVVEAVLTAPIAQLPLAEALDLLGGRAVLQGGIPSPLVCDQGYTRDDFLRYLDEVVRPLRGRRGFVLGMSDNVPPNADFWRVEQVAGRIG